MKNYLIGIIFLSFFFFIPESRSEIILTEEQKQKVAKIDSVLNFYHEQGIFNGTVLVAQAGKVIYQKGFGYANMDTKETLEPKSVFRLASVSKQFTAMCIMMLEEQNKLNYDDDIQANRIYFSHLYTGLQREGIRSYLNIKDAEEEAKDPVPEKKHKELGQLLEWIFAR